MQLFMPDVYVNDQFYSIRDAKIHALDAGLLFGAGLFETILAIGGSPRLLSRHLERLRTSSRALGIPFSLTDEKAESIIGELLERNRLTDKEARVKIIATPGDTGIHYSHRAETLIVTAEPYLRPPLEIPWKLTLLNAVNASGITAHKSTSYLAYRSGLHSARVEGFDDGILLDRYGHVSETTVASLLLFNEDGMIVPASPDALPGITAGILQEICTDLGIAVQRVPVSADDLLAGANICVCNALLGLFPVNRIDQTDIPALPADQLQVLRTAWTDFS